MLKNHLQIGILTTCCLFGLVLQVHGIEIGIADVEAKDGKAIVTTELYEGDIIAKKLRYFRLKAPAPCPRAGLSAEEKVAAIKEAKALLVELKKQRDVVANKPNKTATDYKMMGYNGRAISQSGQVISALGDQNDAKWLASTFTDYLAASALADFYARQNKPFSELGIEGKQGWEVAIKMGEAGDRSAMDYLIKEQQADEKKGHGLITHILTKYGHPKADEYAKASIKAYQEKLAEGQLPSHCYRTKQPALWGILHLLRDPKKNREYLDSLNGIVFDEIALAGPLVVSAMKDPRILIDVMIGGTGQISTWRKNQIARCRWHADLLYAACAGRSSDDINAIVDYYLARAIPIAIETNMVTGGARPANVISGHIMSNIMSAARLSSKAAEICQIYNDSPITEFRYRDTPWIKMAWMPSTVLPHIGSASNGGVSESRLSPFTHAVIQEEANKNTTGDRLAMRAILLWHKCINVSFHTPEKLMLGDRRVGVVRLTGEQTSTAVHTRFHIITTQAQSKLNIGFRLASVHFDGGGLASAIGENHLKLKALHDDHHKAQLSNVRIETKDGNSHPLEFSKTTSGGVHLYSADIPAIGLEGSYLRYDWQLIGEDRYPLVHALFEPWFALIP